MNRVKNVLIVLTTSFLSVALLAINNELFGEVNSLADYLTLLFMSVSITWVIYYGVPFLLHRVRWIRLRFDRLARFEGSWVCVMDVDPAIIKAKRYKDHELHACAIYNFRYDVKEKKFYHSGESYAKSGKLLASYIMRDVQYFPQINGFYYHGKVIRTIKSIEVTDSWGEVRFNETGSKKLNSGRGYFVHNCKEMFRAHVLIERIPKEQSKHLEHLDQRVTYALSHYRDYINNQKSYKNILSDTEMKCKLFKCK